MEFSITTNALAFLKLKNKNVFINELKKTYLQFKINKTPKLYPKNSLPI